MQNKIIVATSIVGGILILFLIIIGVKQYNETKKLREEGIHVEALVINKEVLKNKTHRGKAKGYSRSSEYIIDLAVFIDTTKAKKQKEIKTDPKNIYDKIDALFEKASLSLNPNEYNKVRTSVDVSNYKEISVNQWVTYVYLKEDPEGGRLLMELE